MTRRIVHVVCSDRFAGTERHVATLAAAQTAAGDDVVVVGGDADGRFRAHLGRAAQIPARTVPEAVRALTRLGHVDILHAHMTDAEVAIAATPAHRTVPAVATRHFPATRGSGPARRVVASVAARRLAAQIAVSDFVAARIDGSATVVHPGVPDVPAPSAPAERVVLLAQRLEAEKSTDVAIRAFARSGLPRDGWRLAIAGEGAERPRLEALARDIGAGTTIDFLGHRDDVPDLMARAALFLAPCAVEALGLSVLEAMSAGLPVLAAAAGGHLETVGPVTGAALFPPGDDAAAAVALDSLAGDPAARAAYAEALRAAQRSRFSIPAWVAAHDRVYAAVS